MRLSLIRLGAEIWQFTWSWHHIIMDGWSLPVLHDEVHSAYLNFVDRPIDTRDAFDEITHLALRAVKLRVDPADLIQANHQI